ncbi:MAG: eL32 family ribosomal protein, partial [Candidatus Micrarchaeota archaeon]
MATKHPKFVRPNLSTMKRLADTWRHGRGIDSKQARKVKWAGATPNIGYQGAAATRNRHPQGKKEFYVRNIAELEKFKDSLKDFVIRMQSGLSKRSKEMIRKKASE